jgi:hypothetical protein
MTTTVTIINSSSNTNGDDHIIHVANSVQGFILKPGEKRDVKIWGGIQLTITELSNTMETVTSCH